MHPTKDVSKKDTLKKLVKYGIQINRALLQKRPMFVIFQKNLNPKKDTAKKT